MIVLFAYFIQPFYYLGGINEDLSYLDRIFLGLREGSARVIFAVFLRGLLLFRYTSNSYLLNVSCAGILYESFSDTRLYPEGLRVLWKDFSR